MRGLFSVAVSLGLLCREAEGEAGADVHTAAEAHDSSPADQAPNPALPPSVLAEEDIVVTAKRYGEARVKAESEFSEAEIAPFGAESIQDLLGQLKPFIDPGGEEPVILINGQPAGFDTSILAYPPEALDRLAVLPPEAAAQYGHPSGKRVVNLVLKRQFSSLHGDAGLTWATRGGRHGGRLSAGRVAISGPTRWNVQARISADSALRKSARAVPPRGGPVDLVGYVSSPDGGEIDPALSLVVGEAVTVAALPPGTLAGTLAGAPTLADFAATANRTHPADPNDYETLQSSRRSLSLSAGASRPLGAFSASLSVNAASNASHGRRGLPMVSLLVPGGSPWSPFANDVLLTRPFAVERALRNDNSSKSLGVSLTLSGPVAGWQTNFSANYARSWTNSLLEQGLDAGRLQALVDAGEPGFNPFGPWDERLLLSSRNRSRGERIDTRLNVMRPILELPDGPLTTNISVQASRNRTQSRRIDSLHGPSPQVKTTREQMNGQVSFSLPLSRRAGGEHRPLGDLTLDVSMSGQTESNTPLQKRYGGDLTWSPFSILQLRGSFEHQETTPSFEQLDDPPTSTIARIYDYARQEMAEPVWITGGNPDLGRGSRRNLSVNATVRPLGTQTLTLTVGYRQRVAKGGVASFPELTPAIEAAFPERVTRDAQGRLVAIDARAINIAHDTDRELTSGIALRWQSGAGVQRRADQPQSEEPVPAKPIPPKPIPTDPLVVTASIDHRWRLESELLIRPGLPPIDQLGRDGGQARHLLSAQITAGKRGMGASWNAEWTGPARLRGTTAAGDFHFKPWMMHNLSMHVEPFRILGPLAEAGWAKNLRISLDVRNVFDSYRRVTFEDGSTPAGYSRDEIDPLGRTVRLSVRKRW